MLSPQLEDWGKTCARKTIASGQYWNGVHGSGAGGEDLHELYSLKQAACLQVDANAM